MLPAPTEEILILCRDLKVVSKKDFKNLLKWRLKMKEFDREDSDDESGSGGDGPATTATDQVRAGDGANAGEDGTSPNVAVLICAGVW